MFYIFNNGLDLSLKPKKANIKILLIQFLLGFIAINANFFFSFISEEYMFVKFIISLFHTGGVLLLALAFKSFIEHVKWKNLKHS